jgi:hypothetical protein
MTLDQAISEVMNPPTGMNVTLDNRLNEPDFVTHLINQKRAMLIERGFRDRGDVMPTTHQHFFVPTVDKVDKNEDNFIDLEKDFGKFYLPSLVQFTHRNKSNQNRAIVSITEPSSSTRYFPTSYEEWLVIRGSTSEMKKYPYYFKVGNFVYLTKYSKEISIRGIFQNPKEAHIIDNTIKPSGSLIIGETYKVKNGSVIHNSITVIAPNTFLAVNEIYTGSGLVYRTEPYRLLDNTDPYPMKDSHMHTIKELIWNEFNIAIQSSRDQQGNADEETDTSRAQANASASPR